MSFILDALKKSESDRQRQSGPALFEVKVAAPRAGLPPWAIAVGALLVVNIVIIIWLLLRHAAPHEEAVVPTEPAPPAARTVTAPAPPPSPQAAPSLASSAAPAPAPLTDAAPPPGAAVTAAALRAAAAAAAADAATAGGAAENPEDYIPAAEPPAAPQLSNRVRRGTVDGVPLYQEAVATPGNKLPQLRLDLHVFAERPQDRFVMINMHRLREGDTLPEGVHVDSITPDGAMLSYNGARFLLPRD
jgi:general secretion pathway protein B